MYGGGSLNGLASAGGLYTKDICVILDRRGKENFCFFKLAEVAKAGIFCIRHLYSKLSQVEYL
jgi:hypothetical protein